MMICTRIHELLPDYLGDEIALADRDALEAHLEDCSACRLTVEELRATLDELTALSTIDLPTASEHVRNLPRSSARPPGRWRMLRLVGGIAAVFAVGIFVGRQSLPDGAPASGQAETPIATTAPGPIHPDWIERARATRGSVSGGLATQLALLAGIAQP